MELHIGSQTVAVTVPFNKQNFVRDTETEIDQLYSNLRIKFPKRDERDLLAMIVYQYADYYRELLQIHKKACHVALECEQQISRHEDIAEPEYDTAISR